MTFLWQMGTKINRISMEKMNFLNTVKLHCSYFWYITQWICKFYDFYCCSGKQCDPLGLLFKFYALHSVKKILLMCDMFPSTFKPAFFSYFVETRKTNPFVLELRMNARWMQSEHIVSALRTVNTNGVEREMLVNAL